MTSYRNANVRSVVSRCASRALWAAGITTLLLAASGVAQAEPPPRPEYNVLPWKEDWSVLRGVEKKDFFDPIKYVPMSKDGRYWASFGAQWRLRPEIWRKFNFGVQGAAPNDKDDDEFLLSRIMFHGDFHLGETFRIFLMGKSALSTDRDLQGGTTPFYVDQIDLQDGWIEAKLPIPTDKIDLRVRGGREELLEGRQRLVSPLDWANVRRTFDGANFILRSKRFYSKAFWSRPVRVKKYAFNPSSGNQFFGIYNTMKDVQWVDGFDVYWLSLLSDDVTFNGTTGDENRQTMGGRTWGNIATSTFYYDGEFAYQFGDVGGANINAFMFAGFVGVPFEVLKRVPKVELGFGYASGDDTPGDDKVETFNQLFPLGHAYLGKIDAIGRQNVIDTSLTGMVNTFFDVKARLEGHYFWRASTDDAVYNAGGGVLRPGAAGSSSDVGGEIDLILTKGWGRHFVSQFGYSHFFAGKFIDQAANTPAFLGADKDIDFIYFNFTYRI
ncbi:MAG: hypothetical protein E4H03_01725 [Myxococcales bacterium]|jgi:hypothetical protein|nr:MAG: hypothetical protein E4H03_01725 [Myxococcales bacterium]